MSGSQRRRPVFIDQFNEPVGTTCVASCGKPNGSGANHIHVVQTSNPVVTVTINDEETILACDRPSRRSLAFAHRGQLNNHPAILQGNIGGVLVKYKGVIRKASGKGTRRWALHDAVKL